MKKYEPPATSSTKKKQNPYNNCVELASSGGTSPSLGDDAIVARNRFITHTWVVVLCLFFVTRILRVGVQIFILSLGVGCSPSNHIFLPFFFLPRNQNPTLFFPNITHSDKCSKTVLLNFLLSTPTVLGTISTPTTVNLTINSAREQLSSSQR